MKSKKCQQKDRILVLKKNQMGILEQKTQPKQKTKKKNPYQMGFYSTHLVLQYPIVEGGMTENRISELEDRSIDFTQTKQGEEKERETINKIK